MTTETEKLHRCTAGCGNRVFFAGLCGECQEEIQELNRMYNGRRRKVSSWGQVGKDALYLLAGALGFALLVYIATAFFTGVS